MSKKIWKKKTENGLGPPPAPRKASYSQISSHPHVVLMVLIQSSPIQVSTVSTAELLVAGNYSSHNSELLRCFVASCSTPQQSLLHALIALEKSQMPLLSGQLASYFAAHGSGLCQTSESVIFPTVFPEMSLQVA